MRRIVLCISFVILLAACGKTDVPPRHDFNVSSSVEISYKQMKVTADVKTDENGALRAAVRSPESLDGISFICDESGITAACGEVEIKNEKGYYPFVCLYDTLKRAKTTEPASTEKTGNIIKFMYDGFIIETDEQTNVIKHIETEYCDYEMR